MKMLLNDGWQMEFDGHTYSCDVPCSMYETLIREKAIPDPYQGENEWISTPLSDRDAVVAKLAGSENVTASHPANASR